MAKKIVVHSVDPYLYIDKSDGQTTDIVYAGRDEIIKQDVPYQLEGIVYFTDDPNPTILWEVIIGSGTFSDNSIARPMFTPDYWDGPMTLRLSGTGVPGGLLTDEVQLITSQEPPLVDAGGPYSGEPAEPIQMVATATPGSFPIATYLWEYVDNGPEPHETASFSDTAILNPTFTADGEGEFTLTLTVGSTATGPGKDASDTALCTVSVAETFLILTEDGDNTVTEDGDSVVTEEAP